jgi:ATP-dependent Clp protease protease subunit
MQELIRNIIARHTGQTLEKIAHDTDRDFYLNPEQAVEYGLIDEILNKPTKEIAKVDETGGKAPKK